MARRLLKAGGLIVLIAFAAGSLWMAAWRINGREAGWESASTSDCPLMAQSLLKLKFGTSAGPPLIGLRDEAGPCYWPRYGLQPRRLSEAQFATLVPELSHGGYLSPRRYVEHISLRRPMYSLLHVRAVVYVERVYGNLGSDAYSCLFQFGLSGWQLRDCKFIGGA